MTSPNGRRLTGRRVAGEQDARAGAVAAVAEDHRLHRHRRAEVVGDALDGPVGLGALAVPGAEHRLDRRPQLLPRVAGTSPRPRPRNMVVNRLRQSAANPWSLVALARPAAVSSLRPRLRIVSIIPGIDTGAPERTLTSSGSAGSPKRRPTRRSICPHVRADLVLEPGRPAVGEVVQAGRGGDDEARRDRQRQLAGHHAEVGRLAADEADDVGGLPVVRVAEVVHERHVRSLPWSGAGPAENVQA